jgi:hypothetical protein
LQDVAASIRIYVNDEYFARSELDEDQRRLWITGVASAPSGMPTLSAQYNRTEINIAGIRQQTDTLYTTLWVGLMVNFIRRMWRSARFAAVIGARRLAIALMSMP